MVVVTVVVVVVVKEEEEEKGTGKGAAKGVEAHETAATWAFHMVATHDIK